MRKLKDEFKFSYNKQDIQVKKLGEVYCAIFKETAVPLIIEFNKLGEVHNGKISKMEDNKFLAWLPKESFTEITELELLQSIKNLLNSTDL